MFVVGLTGGIGSGKSTVAGLFSAQGVDIIDADLVARMVVEPGQPALRKIAEQFGEDILDESGQLRRAELRRIVFADASQRQWLERLLHPLIAEEIRRRIDTSSTEYCILVSPLLLETSQRQLVDRVLVVDVDRQTQIDRTLQRDSGSQQTTVEAIIDAQLDRDSRLAAADDVIDNQGAVSDLEAEVSRLHGAYLAIARGK